jgi:hypothetical protein
METTPSPLLSHTAARELSNLIANKVMGEIAVDIGFSSNIFMVFGLPTRRLLGNPAFWTKKSSLCNLTIARDEKYEIPFGCYARMNQIFIDTEVRSKNTNVIDVGQSFREYTEKLGYSSGKANKALVQQLLNYITSVIKVEPAQEHLEPGRHMGIKTLVAGAWDIHFDVRNPEQLSLAKGQIVLEEKYANYIHKHAVPLDMNVVHVFKRNPMALDFYRFLAYRANKLGKMIHFPDHLLFEQLGTDQEADFIVRMRLRRILKAIQTYWPVKARFESGEFILEPSPPAVQHKIPSRKPINITPVAKPKSDPPATPPEPQNLSPKSC